MKIKIKTVNQKDMQYKPKQRPKYCLSCKKLMAPVFGWFCDDCWKVVSNITNRGKNENLKPKQNNYSV